MSGRERIQQLFVGLLLAGVLGCGPARPVYLSSKGQVDKHYINSATRIEYPDTHVETSQEVLGASEPFTVKNATPPEIYDITLEEAICITMQNSKVLRTLSGVGFSAGGVQGTPQALLSSPQGIGTVYDVALTESDPRYGVEAALSAFDAQLKSTLGFSTEDRGTFPKTNPSPETNTGTFQTSIQKTSATGSTFYVTNGNNYYSGNSSSRYPQSYWTSYLEAGVSQPLLQGRGVQFNRIAGPGAIAGFYNGVAIARINTDLSLADFEKATRDMVFDVERAYWNLYYAYHYLESVKAGYISANQTWQQVKKKFDVGHQDGTAQAEAQARTQYFLFRGRAEEAQNNLFKAEATLRYMMGLSANDGRLFRPSSEPTIAPVKLEWNELLVEALARSPELRKQKWEVKKKELELLASKNFLLPNLDLNASYRFNGIGKDLVDSNGSNSAYGSMTRDGYGDWQAGVTLSVPIGTRKGMTAVQNAKLGLARAQSILQEQEIELSHNIQDSLREIDKYYQLSMTGYQKRIAAMDEVRSADTAYREGKSTLDQVLDAQKRLAEAETEFYNNVVQYNLSITELHRRKGSLLEYNNIYLAEGPWPTKAYIDARELARKRDAGQYLNYGYTRPQVFSRGQYQQFQGTQMASQTIQDATQPIEMTPQANPQAAPKQEIQTNPEPEKADSQTKVMPRVQGPAQSYSQTTLTQSELVQPASYNQTKMSGANQGRPYFGNQTSVNTQAPAPRQQVNPLSRERKQVVNPGMSNNAIRQVTF